MKKIIKILMALQIGTTSASFLTSCVKKYQYMYDIWVITSGGSINDKSYIQSAWEGASKYIVSQFTQVSSMTQWRDSPLRASYFEPNGIIPGEFKAAYITASIAGAKTLILPGFSHANTIGWAANLVDNVIFIDGSGQNVHKNMDPDGPLADNIVGILFQKEIAGFLAGLVTTIWLNLHQTEFQQQLNIATYGGMDNPVGVSNYLWGFLLSADVFNEIIKNDVRYPNLHQLMTDILAIIKNINPKINNLLPIRKVQEVLNDNESWFSQSFNQGEGKVISDYLITKKASIIFPVAGPQTQDTIDRIKYNKTKTKVVGVDTAQSQIYGDEYIITSGLLNITQATEDALSNIYSTTCSYNNVTKQWDNKQLDSCWINTDQSSKTNSNWLGIEKTKWINDSIINYINNDAKITKLTTTIGMIYDQIKQEHFTDTLKLTYQKQNKVKTKLLETLEKGLG
ncbi:BMP family ABC transporter substrate-binding protein [Spiroplasma sp. Moj]|uniref:BMP family ABC transporter substrate-binding protein n=1 Tax=Spiroplasma sp. Moj TaxID=1922342 RepID=UPI0039EF3E43|nr:BMP family ABC transporter substrate-binding protein [Spiroplasma sp. Moj]